MAAELANADLDALELRAGLQRAGFSAFAPYQQFIESFAAGPDDLERHRTYVAE
jgi:hypothetical protein